MAANLIVKFKEVAHESYRRKGHDLIYTHKVSLLDAFECKPVTFTTLDGRCITLACDQQIAPQTCKLVEDEGMPIEGTSDRGSLYLTFDVQFPTQFKLETKQRMISALQSNMEALS